MLDACADDYGGEPDTRLPAHITRDGEAAQRAAIRNQKKNQKLLAKADGQQAEAHALGEDITAAQAIFDEKEAKIDDVREEQQEVSFGLTRQDIAEDVASTPLRGWRWFLALVIVAGIDFGILSGRLYGLDLVPLDAVLWGTVFTITNGFAGNLLGGGFKRVLAETDDMLGKVMLIVGSILSAATLYGVFLVIDLFAQADGHSSLKQMAFTAIIIIVAISLSAAIGFNSIYGITETRRLKKEEARLGQLHNAAVRDRDGFSTRESKKLRKRAQNLRPRAQAVVAQMNAAKECEKQLIENQDRVYENTAIAYMRQNPGMDQDTAAQLAMSRWQFPRSTLSLLEHRAQALRIELKNTGGDHA